MQLCLLPSDTCQQTQHSTPLHCWLKQIERDVIVVTRVSELSELIATWLKVRTLVEWLWCSPQSCRVVGSIPADDLKDRPGILHWCRDQDSNLGMSKK